MTARPASPRCGLVSATRPLGSDAQLRLLGRYRPVWATGIVLVLFGTATAQPAAAPSGHSQVPTGTAALPKARSALIARQLRPLSCGFRSWAGRTSHADLVFLAALHPSGSTDDREAQVRVQRVLKRNQGLDLAPGASVRLPDPPPADARLVLVFAQLDGDRGLAVTEAEWITPAVAEYFAGIAQQSQLADRTRWLLEQEPPRDPGEPEVAFQAREELTLITDETWSGLKNQLPTDRLRRRFDQLDPASERMPLYIRVLGLVGGPTDAPRFERWVFRPPTDQLGLQAPATLAYLRTGGPEAARRLTASYFSAGPEQADHHPLQRLQQRYNAFTAVQTLRHAPQMNSLYEVASRWLIANSELVDLVLATARRDVDPRFARDALQRYQRGAMDQFQKSQLVAYLETLRRKQRLPADRQPFAELLQQVQREDALLHAQAMQIIEFAP